MMLSIGASSTLGGTKMHILRHATEQDMTFIRSSWCNSYAKSAEARLMDYAPLNKYERLFEATVPKPSMYKRLQNMVIRHCVYNSVTAVACWAEDPNVILGWACGLPGKLLHYVAVKPEWQGQGVARSLFGGQALDIYGKKGIIYTHETDTWRKPDGWVYVRSLAISPEKAKYAPEVFED